ncbi:MAG: hypothetical protein AAB605_03370 [Patescibacteria group bacterium]
MSDSDASGDPNVTEENSPPYYPYFPLESSIPHYYGNYVRQIFMVAGVAMLVGAPFLINRVPDLVPFQIGGAIALVVLAALTSPRKQFIIVANVIAAALGVLVFEWLSILAYRAENMIAFVLLEAVTIAFLFALYFSTKTLRAMFYRQLGKTDRALDFIEEERR